MNWGVVIFTLSFWVVAAAVLLCCLWRFAEGYWPWSRR